MVNWSSRSLFSFATGGLRDKCDIPLFQPGTQIFTPLLSLCMQHWNLKRLPGGRDGDGERQGVEHLDPWVSSHWSSCLTLKHIVYIMLAHPGHFTGLHTSSCGVGPPSPEVGSPFEKNSNAVDKSHIWVAPQAWPVNINLKPDKIVFQSLKRVFTSLACYPSCCCPHTRAHSSS